MTLSSSAIYRPIGPRDPAVETRLELFERMNAFIAARGGWVTSLKGEVEIRFDALPGSIIPGDLRAIGHRVLDDGEGERIVPTGAHAGIVAVKRYAMTMQGSTNAPTSRARKKS